MTRGKSIPAQAYLGPATWGLRTDCLYPKGNIPDTNFNVNKKNSIDTIGDQTHTFRRIEQCLNQLRQHAASRYDSRREAQTKHK